MGSLYRRKNQVFYGAWVIRGRRKYVSTRCRKYEEAKVVFDRLCAEFEPFKNLTVSQFRIQLAKILEGTVSPGTAAINEDVLLAFERVVGDLKLRTVTPYHVELYKAARLKEVSPATVARDFRHLKAAFRRAHQWKMVESTPFAGVRNVRVPEAPPQFLSPVECERLLRVIDVPTLKAVVIFAVSTGMRLGEIVNLRWIDLDRQGGMIHLENRDGFTTKNRRSRSLPMNATVRDLLAKLSVNGEHVFTGQRGRRLNAGWVSRKFKRFARAAGLSEHIHFHSLRHTFASWLVQNNVPILCVKDLLHHQNIATTLVYARSAPEQLKESVQSIDPYLRAAM